MLAAFIYQTILSQRFKASAKKLRNDSFLGSNLKVILSIWFLHPFTPDCFRTVCSDVKWSLLTLMWVNVPVSMSAFDFCIRTFFHSIFQEVQGRYQQWPDINSER